MDLKVIQRKFLRNMIIIAFLVTGFLLLIQQTYDTYVREGISKTYISELATQAEREFNLYNQPVINNLFLAQRWGQSGLLRLDDPEKLNATFMPILDQTPQIYAVKLVDSLSNFYSLTRKENQWETILNHTKTGKEKSLIQEWSDEGNLIKKRWDSYDYSPLTRPWYHGAKDRDGIFWTTARQIQSAGSPGISASIKWNDKQNRLLILAFDVLLKDIYDKIYSIKISENSQVFLFRNDGTVPNIAALDSPGVDGVIEEEFFINPSINNMDLISTSLEEWGKEDMESDEPLHFSLDNVTYWSGFRKLENDRGSLWIGFILPEKDLFGQVQEQQQLFVLLFILISAFGILALILQVKKYRNKITNRLIGDPNIEQRVMDTIKAGENIKCEFKSTMRMNLKTGQSGREIEMAWLKTVCAFMNTEGGMLLFGIQDDGHILGIESDNFENEDRVRLHFKNLINQHIGAEYSSSLRFHVLSLSEKTVAILECESSPKPVFLKNKNDEFFYIRSGPSSIKLSASKFIEYLDNRKARISWHGN